MAKNNGRREGSSAATKGHLRAIDGSIKETKGNFDADVDALFKLPLAEFTGARNALAAHLKKNGWANDASLVKALAKPPISAWAVNQLYWKHREAFNDLIAAGQRLQRAQTSGKAAEMRSSLEERREVLSQLSDLATSLLSRSGHNPALDTLRRITTTLEALSAFALLSEGPTPGRLTHDVDPPGFESLTSLILGGATNAGTQKSARPTTPQKLNAAASTTRPKATSTRNTHHLEEARRAKIAAARVSLQNAKRSLTEARSKTARLETMQKQAGAEAKEAEKQKREAEIRFKKASAAAEAANERARNIVDESQAAAKAVEDAKRAIEKSSKELESLFGESPGK